MGNSCCVSANRTERSQNYSPDEQIQQKTMKKGSRKSASEQQQRRQLVRFFMTGLGSAGKTTIIRQLMLLSKRNSNYKLCDEDWNEVSNGLTEKATAQMEQRQWARQIRRNILDIFDIIIKHINGKGENFDSEVNRQFSGRIEEICDEQNWEEIDADLAIFRHGLIALFRDGTVKETLKHRNKIEVDDGKKLFDGCEYFLREEKIAEIFSADYVVDDETKVHSRNPTTDMRTYRFILNQTRIEITDVGGQRSELVKIVDYLRNWSFSCEDNSLNFILLVVSMSDYNQKHPQYEGTLLDECVEYMKVLMNNQIAQNCGLLIFFNKKDRFKEKLMDADCREDIAYLGPHLSPKQARDYLTKGKFDERQIGNALAKKFVEAIEGMKERRKKDTYCRFTCAIDSKMMEGIFGAIKDDILNENIHNVF